MNHKQVVRGGIYVAFQDVLRLLVDIREFQYSSHEKWRKEIFDVILKYRVADSDFKALGKKNKIYLCERHYSKDSIELTNTDKKTGEIMC